MSMTTLTATEKLVRTQLRTALTMEDDSLASLEKLEAATDSSEITELFRHHQDETKQQIENLHRVFAVLDVPMLAAPSPSTKGIADQAEMLLEEAGTQFRDQATLVAALGNEHFEVGAYTALLALVAESEPEVAHLLEKNLDQERHTGDEIARLLRSFAR